jgi:hypothetical protein
VRSAAVAHTGSVDGRWLLLSLVVAAFAAIRWRRRAPGDEAPGKDGAAPQTSVPPTFDAWADARMDAQLDAQLDRPADGAGDAHQPGQPGQPGEPDGILGLDGLNAALDRVWAEHGSTADTLLDTRLRLIIHRGIPARAIRPAPGLRTVRVVFADGTILLCRGTGQGDFGRLGLALQQHRSVRLGSFSREVNGTRLEFRWHPDHRLAATAVGLDQPD